MANDDDIARLLPEPPPPRPVRREAAIAEAMRRFDGTEAPPPVVAARPTRWRGRPQFGALISVALIALIGAPAAWMSLHDRFPDAAAPAATNATETVATAGTAAPPINRPSPAAAPAQSSPAARAGLPPRAASRAPVTATADKVVAARESNDVPGAPPPSAAAMKMAAPDAAQPPPPPTASAVAPSAEARADDTGDIMVTGSRRHAPVVADRIEGFSRAPDDDLDGVIARFDQALARDPHNSRAWLDRGRARQRRGDLAGALDDLDHAIRLAPDAPAGYRARAQIERQRGDTARAVADERRAAALEP